MGKETPNIVDKYLKVLDKLAGSLVKNQPIRTFISNNKPKVIGIFFLLLTLLTMYTIWDRGECINCPVLTASEVEEYVKEGHPSKSVEWTWHEYYKTKHYVPYITVTSYLKDLWFPLTMTLLQGFIGLSIVYIAYKAYKLLMKSLALLGTKLFKPPHLKDR